MCKLPQDDYRFSDLEVLLLNMIGFVSLYESDREGRPDPLEVIFYESVSLLSIHNANLEEQEFGRTYENKLLELGEFILGYVEIVWENESLTRDKAPIVKKQFDDLAVSLQEFCDDFVNSAIENSSFDKK